MTARTRSWPPLLAAVLLAAGFIAAPATAGAAVRRALVFPLTGSLPGGHADTLAQLTRVVARSAGLTGAEVTIGQVSFEDTAALAGCSSVDVACLAQVAQVLHVDHIVLGTVEPAADKRSAKVSLTAFIDGKITRKTFVLPVSDSDTMVKQLAREAPSLFVGSAPAEPAEPPPVAPAPGPALVVAPPPPRSAHEDRFHAGHVRTYAWVVAGGGVLLAGSGGVLLLMARSRQDEVDAAPTGSVADFRHLQELEDQGARYTSAGNVLLIGGAAALITGTALVLYQGWSHQGRAEQARVSWRPLLAPSGAGVALEVTLP